jgi:hypothetical protein
VRLDSIYRILFVVYCLEAGLFLAATPWGDGWEQLLATVPLGAARALLATTWARSAVSGFGAIHLVWAAHDFDLVLRRRAPPQPRDAGDSATARR